MRKADFGFEKLDVWQKAVGFSVKVIDLTENLTDNRKHFRLVEQLESASASIACNIAEGKGRYSRKEFIQYLYIARGSLFETITLLNIFLKKHWINEVDSEEIRVLGEEIGKMISGLISSIKNKIS